DLRNRHPLRIARIPVLRLHSGSRPPVPACRDRSSVGARGRSTTHTRASTTSRFAAGMKWERAPGTPPRSFAITLTTVANRPLQSSRRGHVDRVTPGLAPPHRPKKGLKGHAFIDEECVGRQEMSMNAIRFPLLTRKSIQLGTALLCTSAPACDMGRESKVS